MAKSDELAQLRWQLAERDRTVGELRAQVRKLQGRPSASSDAEQIEVSVAQDGYDEPGGYLLDTEAAVEDGVSFPTGLHVVAGRPELGHEPALAFSRRLVEAIENERRSLARDLHDQAGQSLVALKMSVGHLRREVDARSQHAARFEEVLRLIDGVMDDLHDLAVNLRPVSLDRSGLCSALQQYADFFRRHAGIDLDLVTAGIEEERLPAAVEVVIYRVVQESLTNVVRHANAAHVAVIVERRNDRALAIIEDDGQGFDVAAAELCPRLGLVGMRERVEMLGGHLVIESTPGMGTSVFAEVPCSPGED